MATRVLSLPNATPAVAPPAYYLPNAAGSVIPAGHTGWVLTIDQTNIPAAATYTFDMEYQISGTWVLDTGGTFAGGPVPLEGGGSTFINTMQSSIGTLGPDGKTIGVYPTRARIHVKSYGGWTLPTLTLDLN